MNAQRQPTRGTRAANIGVYSRKVTSNAGRAKKRNEVKTKMNMGVYFEWVKKVQHAGRPQRASCRSDCRKKMCVGVSVNWRQCQPVSPGSSAG